MDKFDKISDQCYKGSAANDRPTDNIASTPCLADTTAAVDEARVSQGLAGRALQAMWQAGVQVCPGAGSWSQILSLSKPCRASSGDDLRAPGLGRAGGGLSCESCGCPRTVGGDLRDKPDVVKKSRGFLSTCDGRCTVNQPPGECRLVGGGRGGGQYDSGLSWHGIGGKGERG